MTVRPSARSVEHPAFGAVPANSIVAVFVCRPDCPTCLGCGHVCENHPDRPWAPIVGDHPDACDCGAGMPCPRRPPQEEP